MRTNYHQYPGRAEGNMPPFHPVSRYFNLREKVLSIMNHSEEYEDVLQKGRDTFSNQGNVCKDIMDAIDYYTQEGTEDGFMSRKLESEYRAFNMWN